jgi:DNA-directed RNA polymerase subunit RPC12/RpoP
MSKIHEYQCINCDADFKIKHDMDSDYWHIEYCPFCGDKLDEDNFVDDEDN